MRLTVQPSRIRRSVLWLLAAHCALFAAAVAAHDGEWPPRADPQWDGSRVIGNPTPSNHLYLDRVEFTIPNTPPYYYADWISHFHAAPGGCGFGGWKTDFAIGDVDNDGQADDIVITMAGEAVFAAEMVLDFGRRTGHLEPLWLWLTPWAWSHVERLHPPRPPNHELFSCLATSRNNPLIWNLVADGGADDTNEVAFVGLEDDGTENGQRRLFVLRTDPSAPSGVQVVARSPLGQSSLVQGGIGVCRVRKTAFPRDIVLTEHGPGNLSIWSHESGPALTLEYEANPFGHPQILAGAHAYNWLDIDGDGFDEFFLNGLVDFVDAGANGNPVPTNGAIGVARWQIMRANVPGQQGYGAHCDNIFAADWDPHRPGLEVYAVTEEGLPSSVWVEARTGRVHSAPWDTLWDADCGTLLHEWRHAPAQDGQNIFGGNWTKTHDGLEAILSPKDLTRQGQVLAPGEDLMTGSYVSAAHVTPAIAGDDELELLTIDGALYSGNVEDPYDPANLLRVRSGGPWRRMFPMDWDGDYSSDEILHHPLDQGNLIVFRLGAKGDWGSGPLPPGLPTRSQVESSTPPIGGEGDDPSCAGAGWWCFYSQGECGEQGSWNWSHGGPGRGTHYFEKLKEVFPNTGEQGAVVVKPYDLGGPDQREEIIAISVEPSPMIHVYFNGEPLAARRPSPHGSLAYRAFRQWRTEAMLPFSFQDDAVAIERFGIRPRNRSLPDRVVGLPFGGSVQLEAYVRFADGTETKVTNFVTWRQDGYSPPHFSLSPGGLVRHLGAATVSGRFHAEMVLEGELRRSEPSYVFASSSAQPAILRAGFGDSWIVDDPALDDRSLRIEAWIGQRDNQAPAVFTLDLDGSRWQDAPLHDDGRNGDARARDGIYTTVVTNQTGLSRGNNLRVVRAIQPPFGSPAAPGFPPTGAATSVPWPYFAVGASANPPWSAPPAPAPLSSEPQSYEAPRIRALGYRGWNVPGELLLEVEVVPSPLHPNAAISVYADVPLRGSANPVQLIDRGNGIYSKKLSTAGTAPGLYVAHVVAVATDPAAYGSGVYVSDSYPRIRLHGYPHRDVDQAPELPGWCLEPLRW